MDKGRTDVDLGTLSEDELSAWYFNAQQAAHRRDRRKSAALVAGLIAVLIGLAAAAPAFASDLGGSCGGG